MLFELGGLLLVTVLTPNFNFFMPIRPTLLTVVLAQHIPWLAVGLVASIGGVLGVLPLYGIAYRVTEDKRVQRWMRMKGVGRLLRWMQHKTFLLIILLVVTPLPDQLIGIAGGVEQYPLRRFLLANMIGRVLIYVPLAYVAAAQHQSVQSVWTWLENLVTI